MKRIFTFFLAVLLVAVTLSFAACTTEEESSSEVSEVSETSDTALVPSLGKTDKYNGKVLRVLDSGGDYAFGHQVFGAEQNDEAEPVNEACLARNARIEEEYGFTIETEFIDPFDPFLERVQQDTISGTVTYDVLATGLTTMASLASDGYLLDLMGIEGSHLDLTASWWDQASIEDMTIGGHLFFATGDITLMDDEYTRCIFYNKTLAEINDLGDLEEYVYEGKWTLDLMYEMIQTVASEQDDGTMDIFGNDIWGCVSDSFDLYSLVLGCDCPQVEKDQDDYPVFAMMNEKNVAAWTKAQAIITDKSRWAYTEEYYRWNDADASNVKNQFYIGKSLFLVGTISAVNSENLRSAEIHYGILPMPKYDENQEAYATTVTPYHFGVVGIVSSCQDTDFVTFALETLAYTNSVSVTSEYYDRTLKNKRFLDDDDSPEMLDLLFSNRLIDISVAFNWNDCIQYYNESINGNSGSLVSLLESKQSAFDAAMQETIDYFKMLDE